MSLFKVENSSSSILVLKAFLFLWINVVIVGQNTEEDLMSHSKEAFLCNSMKEEKCLAELRSFQNFLEEKSIEMLLNIIIKAKRQVMMTEIIANNSTLNNKRLLMTEALKKQS
ncbi:10745_t:CDS:2, partial [Funneliformis geosporum]